MDRLTADGLDAESMASVFMTVDGRQQDTTAAIDASDAGLGAKSSVDVIDGYDPVFVDFPFVDPEADFDDHLQRVRDIEPRVAVAPDIEKGRTLSEVVEKADILLEYSDSVIVVPKSVPPSEVPRRFRVGVPLADYGSGAPWSIWRYRDCGPVHLLGGGPARQLEVGRHVKVASVDTATLGKTCRFGYWDGSSQDAPDEWDYRRRLRESLDNYAAVWA
jgi:hypothetical protein